MLNTNQVQKVINEIRPALQLDGGDLELVAVDEKQGIVKVKLQGRCAHCLMAQITFQQLVESELKKAIPDIKEVVKVD